MQQARLRLMARFGRYYSQSEVAARTGISERSLTRWETGQALPLLDYAALLAADYGIPIEQFVEPGWREPRHT